MNVNNEGTVKLFTKCFTEKRIPNSKFRISFFNSFWTILGKNWPPSGGLEPPTFRLTVERASQLRHGGVVMKKGGKKNSKAECVTHE